MRETNSLRDRMIDRNWVLKRKRKRVSCRSGLYKNEGISQTLESTRNNDSLKRKLKGDLNISRFSQKIKGHDGYYFECVECDLGGNLLCCDSCPRTYHLECLKPPLKRTPPGKWQCPHCSGQKDFVKPSCNADVKLRQAKTKTSEKTRASYWSPDSDKLSLDGRNPIHRIHKSSNKRKVNFPHELPSEEKHSVSSQVGTSCRTKSRPPYDDGSMDGLLIPEDNKIKKKTSPTCDRKKGSSKDMHSLVKTLDLSDIAPTTKPEIYTNKMKGKKLILASAQSSQKPKKKKRKADGEDNKRRTMTEKEKHVAGIVYNHLTRGSSPGPETSESLQKCQTSGQRISASVTEDDELKIQKTCSQKHPEGSPEEATGSSHGLDEQGLGIDKTMKCYENFLDGTQQVDRILGCRVQSNNIMSSNHSQPIKPDISPSHAYSGSKPVSLMREPIPCDLSTPGNQDKLLEGDHADDRTIDMKDIERVHSDECRRSGNGVDGNKDKIDNTVLEAVDSVKTRKIQEASETFKERCLAAANCENFQLLGDAADTEESIEKSSEVDADAKLVTAATHSNNNLVELSHVSDSRDCKVAKQTSLEGQADSTAENRMVKNAVQDSVPMDKENFMYEFLVKWVGQSNIHNSWVSESDLKILAKRKLENYKAKYGTAIINICEDQWCIPQKIIALRNSKDGTGEALVKWCGLPYDECTWERLDEPVIEKSSHLIAEFKQFETETQRKDSKDYSFKAKSDGCEVVPLLEQPKLLQGGSLFPHQLEALNWLRKCWHKSKNVILADEMGLGKTVSACAFISSLYFEFKAKLPCLVLVPLSTMPNWMAEFSQWTPHLNVVEYHGGAKARSIIRQYEWHACCPSGSTKTTSYKFNVLLTTYEMVLADSSYLRGVPWEVLVVDEGHRLKNSESKLFSLLNTFSFQHRVLLTGTPLQNNIGEMYNLLNFLQPASFPSLSAFEEKFKSLTTAEKVEELKKLVAAHMLRRLKRDAMQNIPPKTEHIVPVELSSIQAEYYRAMLTKNYQILRNIGKGAAQQSLLNVVMQLRKVCNHPYLIPGTEPESGSVEFLQEMRIKASGKLTLLHSMFKVLNKEGHRVLLFSQMTKLLDILEDYLTIEFGPRTFERVDGSVSVADRQAAIARFNQDKSRFVFLLSTRSCGLGINLATADTVIIYDSDFNPHADIQAMNRAHRIGQSNRLLVYRLVVRASVEERILQLAKKKLMLDQLFVNKSESQKEVEDILRWGTEELFSECEDVGAKDSKEGSTSIAEAVADGDFMHRRRAGGLGDVYKDRCTDGSSKIVWDENAIMKLLDRSNLQSAVSESTDGDLDNDMLGAVKSLEWNDEPNEEPGGTELLTGIASDGPDQAFEVKEDNVTSGAEENEWDRLLRVRWEKRQIEEEAALGRGKRLRKAISYRETFAPIPSEALSESGNEDEEPEPEYTSAGRALKAKFAKLRARQKERLAQRHNKEVQRPESSIQQPISPSKEMESLDMSKPVEDSGEQVSSIDLEDTNLTRPLETNAKGNLIPRPGRFLKHGHKRFRSNNLNLSFRAPGALSSNAFSSNQQSQSANYAHLPVLGLCAPNANQIDSTSRNFQSFLRLPPLNHEQSKASSGIPDFPLPPPGGAGPSNDLNVKDTGTDTDPSLLPSTSTDALHQRLKSIIPDGYFPFSHRPPTMPKGRSFDPLDSSDASFSTFQAQMSLPDLALNDNPPPKLPLPSKSAMKPPHLDLLPSLSLGTNSENLNNHIQDLPNIPLVPDFRQHLSETLKLNHQVPEILPMLGLGWMPAPHSSLPENHKKVLDNIMMRTGSSRNKFLKKRLKVDAWSEDELDALWIGVRRHGRGNWEAMLRDPKLKFSKHRTSEDLSITWAEEQLKIFDGPAIVASKSSKLPTFPGISDGMMTRALLGSKFASVGTDPPKLCSHLTDIQLGCGDLMPPLYPRMEPSKHFGAVHDSFPPLPAWHPDKFRSGFPGDFGAGPSERSGSLTMPLDLPFQHPLAGNHGSVSVDCPASHDSRENEDELRAKYNKLPNLLDRPLSLLHEQQNTIHLGEPSSRLSLDPKQKQKASTSSMIKETAAGSSKVDKLPHWLREAVSVPPTKPPEPELPPTVSAIAQSVRLLYGEEKSTIPPFTIPGPPPFQPKDPRKILKKKRKLHKARQATPEVVSAIKNFDVAASSSISPAQPLMTNASYLPWAGTELSPPSLNLNLNTPSPSSFVDSVKKSAATFSPSPEVLSLVASCMAPGSSMLAVPDTGISCQNVEVPVSNDPATSGLTGKAINGDLECVHGKGKGSGKSPLGGWEKLTEEEQIDQLESGYSSKTCSHECQIDLLGEQENLSEETLSDGHQSEQKLECRRFVSSEGSFQVILMRLSALVKFSDDAYQATEKPVMLKDFVIALCHLSEYEHAT